MGSIAIQLASRVEIWPVSRLVPYDRNSRTHSEEQVAQVAASIREFGFTNPILAASDGVIVAGHARLAAAKKLGMPEVPVIIIDHLTDAQRRALVIADNRLALNAGWDEEMLRSEILALEAQAFQLDLLGFPQEELEDLLRGPDVAAAGGITEDDDVPDDIPGTATSRTGDVWICGAHRILCGDSTKLASCQTVLDGELADLIFTDPPYNVNYTGGHGAEKPDREGIANDALGEEFEQFLRDACKNILSMSRGAIYICMSSKELSRLHRIFIQAGGYWSDYVIWAKDRFTLGRADYQRQYEPILYGWREGGKHYWCGDRNQGDVWNITRPHKSDLHPTMKPVELVERAVLNSSRRGDVVLDPFGGAGSTMIACHKTGRRARLIELAPNYVDVTVRRWQEFSGEQAMLLGNERGFSEVAKEGRS